VQLLGRGREAAVALDGIKHDEGIQRQAHGRVSTGVVVIIMV
jgi:hypothetical protein